jgi:membrane protein YqaA with SNARE-associated domain
MGRLVLYGQIEMINEMEYLMKLLIVFGLGTIELWIAIPTGIVLQLHPLETCITAATGAMLGVLIVLMLGEGARNRLMRQKGKSEEKKHGSIYNIWARYGVAGLGLLAPLLVDAQSGDALGISLGAPINRLLLWRSLGIVLWSAILTLMSTYTMPYLLD